MIISDAPEPEDHKTGTLFSGPSGTLLQNMLNSIGLNREQIYLTTLIPSSPPAGRLITQEDVQDFKSLMIRQIDQIQPKILLLLGKISIQTLLDPPYPPPLDSLYHSPTLIEPIIAIPTLHLSHILHSPDEKKTVWRHLVYLKKKCAS